MVPEVLKLVGVKMHMHRAKVDFFEHLDFVVNIIESFLLWIDTQRVLLGFPSKFGLELGAPFISPGRPRHEPS